MNRAKLACRMQFPVVITLIALSLTAPGLSLTSAQERDDIEITLVGGREEPQTYPDQVVEGFEFRDMSYRSLYPDGLEFRATILPPEGVTVDRVTLFYTFATGKGGRIAAQRGLAPDEWVARPYAARGLPPWHELDAYWGVRTDTVNVNSEPVHAVYYDASREWYRAESEDVLVYWYGTPEAMGRTVIEAMAANRARYLAGFGQALPFRPMAVIFPPGPDWNEYRGDSSIDDTEFGFTGTIISEAGSTIQRTRPLTPATLRRDCIWNPANPDETYQMNMAASTVAHEVAHLYQQETGVQRGPAWWIEGQATFFETFEEYPIHERLRRLAELRGDDLPTLQGEGPARGTQITAEDGCTHMGYDMGASFMAWLTETYGGIETYRAVVEAMRRGASLGDALDTVTGLTLLELENEWRAFLGVGPVSAEVLDPGAALAAPAEPHYAEGEAVVLPPAPLQVPMYSRPTERSVANVSCFANTPITVMRAGSDGTTNWYEVECMGLIGWLSQHQIAGAQ